MGAGSMTGVEHLLLLAAPALALAVAVKPLFERVVDAIKGLLT